MRIHDERQLLSIIRDAVSNRGVSQFVKTVSPLFDGFITSGVEKDEYLGWTFDLTFINASLFDCGPYQSAVLSEDKSWIFFPEGKDDCTYVIPDKGLIKIHLHSFLWNYY